MPSFEPETLRQNVFFTFFVLILNHYFYFRPQIQKNISSHSNDVWIKVLSQLLFHKTEKSFLYLK